jgi:hypothetical protein
MSKLKELQFTAYDLTINCLSQLTFPHFKPERRVELLKELENAWTDDLDNCENIRKAIYNLQSVAFDNHEFRIHSGNLIDALLFLKGEQKTFSNLN